MARDTRRIHWDDVQAGMLVVVDPDYPPREVDQVEPSDRPDEVYAVFKNGGGRRYGKEELATVVTESGSLEPVKFREDAYLGTKRSLTTLVTFLKLAQLGYMRDDSSVAFFKPQIQREWNNLSQLMKDAGF